jgi:hypothetical protein
VKQLIGILQGEFVESADRSNASDYEQFAIHFWMRNKTGAVHDPLVDLGEWQQGTGVTQLVSLDLRVARETRGLDLIPV